jgi:hypothetical protein
MADTYYGYSERVAENQIDWATIGKDLSKALKDEAVLRKGKQVALETSIRDTTKKISNYEVGDSSLENQKMSQLASNTTQYLQTLQNLWKSGEMSTQQLTEGINNVNTGVEGALELNKDYQAEYKQTLERANAASPQERSQILEQWEKAEIGSYGNLRDTQYYIDPTSGLINLTKIKRDKVDGKEVTTSIGNEFMTINDARSRLKNKYDYFDSGKTTTDIATALGTTVIDIREKGGPSSAGIIRSITDPRYRTDLNEKDAKLASLFEDVVNRQIDGVGSNPLNVSSYLTNDVKVDPLTGKTYTFTRNPDEQTSSEVLLLKIDEMGRSYVDFSGEMGKKQYQVFKEKMRDDILMKIDTKEELDTYNEPEPNYRGTGDGDEDDDKYDAFSITVYENSNNAIRTGNFGNLDPKLASYKQEYDEKNQKYYVIVQEKEWSEDDQKYIAKGKPKRVYSADGLAKYVKGVDAKGVVPSQAYNRGKNDWSKQHEGNVLKGFYSKKDKESQTGVRRGGGELDD